jgi:hypothetical protein
MEYACMENNMVALLEGAITPWTENNDEPTSVVPARWEWTSFDLTKPQTYTGVVKESTWDIDKLATAKVEVAGKIFDVMLGLPIRLDFRGIAEEDVAAGRTLTFEAVPGKQNPNDLRIQTYTVGKNVIDAR